MKRRTFLKTLSIITGTLVTSPIKGLKALEQQGPIKAFKNVQSGNTLFSPTLIAKEALNVLKENLMLINNLPKNAKLWESKFDELQKNGTIKIRKPPRL